MIKKNIILVILSYICVFLTYIGMIFFASNFLDISHKAFLRLFKNHYVSFSFTDQYTKTILENNSSEYLPARGYLFPSTNNNLVREIFIPESACLSDTNIPRNILCNLKIFYHCQYRTLSQAADDLYIIAPIFSSDPDNYPLLYEHHKSFQNYIKSQFIPFINLEAIYQGQAFQVTVPNNEPFDIQIIHDQIFLKRQNLLNVAIRKLPSDWQYAAWMDVHQTFINQYWFEEFVYKLEHYSTVQPFMNKISLNIMNESAINKNFMSSFYNSFLYKDFSIKDPFNSDNLFGIRREVYENIEYLLDECILGLCDYVYVTTSLDQNLEVSKNDNASWKRYISKFGPWINKARGAFNGRRSYIRGTTMCFEHEREEQDYLIIISAVQFLFDQERDIYRDQNLTIYLNNSYLEKIIRGYILQEISPEFTLDIIETGKLSWTIDV